MRFSIWPEQGRPVAELFDTARLTEQLGWYGFWFADHYMPNTFSEEVERGDVHECWAVLPAIAAITSTVRIGSLVAPTSIHHPALLANRAATIDHISNGRMVLGLGAGWQINEHHVYGFELEPPGPRVNRFEEAIQIVRSLLDNDTTRFDGSVYRILDAPADPKPVQPTLPILVGTGGRRMCRITARHAQEWNTWGGPAMAAERRTVFEQACEAVDVDPASMHTSVQALVVLTDDPDRLAKIANGPGAGRSIAGSHEQIIDEVGQLRDLGFDELIVPDFALGRDAAERHDAFREFAAEIAPAI